MNLNVDSFAALGRAAASFSLWLLLLVVRVVALIAWFVAAFGVIVSYRVSLILGAILTIVFGMATWLILYALNRPAGDRVGSAGQTAAGDGGVSPLLVKLVLGLIAIILFFKYIVQVQLLPQGA
jgi:hypothetical protein